MWHTFVAFFAVIAWSRGRLVSFSNQHAHSLSLIYSSTQALSLCVLVWESWLHLEEMEGEGKWAVFRRNEKRESRALG